MRMEPAETAQKHLLQNQWTFWYFENNKDKNWEENLRVVSPFNTVEDFWSIYNHIKNASDLRQGCSYFVFKEGIKPMWEDVGNRAGGRWLISFDKRHRSMLDNQWLEVVSIDYLSSAHFLIYHILCIIHHFKWFTDSFFTSFQLLCLVGEAFDDDGDDICGVVVDIRGKLDKISIWTADCKNQERILNIGYVNLCK